MANKADEDDFDHEEEGGPVKSFLDHLEDLRWTLVKSAVAIAIGFLICLIGGDKVVGILKRPLEHAIVPYLGTNQIVRLLFQTNFIAQFELKPGQPGYSLLGTNQFQNVQLTPIPVVTASGTNFVLGLVSDTNSPPPAGMKIPTDLAIFSPAGGFMVAFQVAIYGGIVLASPFLIFFIGEFVVPALKVKEKRYVYRAFAIGTVLFLSGVSFCYFILLRYALAASYLYTTWLGFSSPQWRAEEYISFVCKFMLGMGVGFEQPVILLALVKIGVLDYAKLKAFRKYMIVINLILGAVLTTPEVVTQILLAVPLQLLYEITIWVAWYWERQERKREKAEGLQ